MQSNHLNRHMQRADHQSDNTEREYGKGLWTQTVNNQMKRGYGMDDHQVSESSDSEANDEEDSESDSTMDDESCSDSSNDEESSENSQKKRFSWPEFSYLLVASLQLEQSRQWLGFVTL